MATGKTVDTSETQDTSKTTEFYTVGKLRDMWKAVTETAFKDYTAEKAERAGKDPLGSGTYGALSRYDEADDPKIINPSDPNATVPAYLTQENIKNYSFSVRIPKNMSSDYLVSALSSELKRGIKKEDFTSRPLKTDEFKGITSPDRELIKILEIPLSTIFNAPVLKTTSIGRASE